MTKNKNKILYIVQARTNSERVPNKMIRKFSDTCLFEIFLEKINKSNIPNEQFYASVYDQELIDLCDKHGINVFRRSFESRNSENDLVQMYEWWDKFPQFEYAVLFNPCLPFLSVDTINNFVESYAGSIHDGMFGVIYKKQYYWNKAGEMTTPWPAGVTIMNTKIVEPTLEAAHALYAGRLDLIGQGKWMGDFTKDNPVLFEMNEFECLDIDYEWQFELYTHYWEKHYGKTNS